MKQRTSLLLVVLGAIAVTLLLWWGRQSTKVGVERDETRPKLVVLSFGGDFADAQRAAYFRPFEAETGIKVEEASYNGEYGRLKAAVESGSVLWDVVDIESSALLRGTEDRILLPIDYSVVRVADLIPQAIHQMGVGTDLYSVSLGFNRDIFPDSGPQPRSWRDFWDVDKFPGPRCLKKDPRFTLEIALMADGVPREKVYAGGSLDVNRAFKSLDRIKPHVAVWWTTGQQPVDLLSSGEVAIAAAFGARLFNAQYKQRAPVVVTWNEGILDFEYWAVLRGARAPQRSLRFIDFASQAESQARLPLQIPLGPVNTRAFDLIDPELAARLNSHPDNLQRQLFFDTEFWAKNESRLRERFNAWLQE